MAAATAEKSASRPPPTPFRYFFSGLDRADPDFLPREWYGRFGLDLDPDASPYPEYPHGRGGRRGFCATVIAKGPEGRSGVLAAPYMVSPEHWGAVLDYDPETIREEVEVEDGVWLLVSNDFTPEQIMRKPPLIDCNAAVLRVIRVADDVTGTVGHWYIPCCLPSAGDACLIPMCERFERGAWRRVAMPQYRDIAQIADRLYRAECGEQPWPSAEWLREATIAAVSVNYEITPAELGALGLLTDVFYIQVASLLTDRPARAALRAAQEAGRDTTVHERQHALWRDGRLPDYRPTAADLDLAAGRDHLPPMLQPAVGPADPPDKDPET